MNANNWYYGQIIVTAETLAQIAAGQTRVMVFLPNNKGNVEVEVSEISY